MVGVCLQQGESASKMQLKTPVSYISSGNATDKA